MGFRVFFRVNGWLVREHPLTTVMFVFKVGYLAPGTACLHF